MLFDDVTSTVLRCGTLFGRVGPFYRPAFCVVVFVIVGVLIHLVYVSCFVLMKFVSMFLFEFDFGVVFVLLVSFHGCIVLWSWTFDFLWQFCLLICDFFFRARFVFVFCVVFITS